MTFHPRPSLRLLKVWVWILTLPLLFFVLISIISRGRFGNTHFPQGLNKYFRQRGSQPSAQVVSINDRIANGKLNVSQDDARLVNYIQKNHLTLPPNPRNPEVDTTRIAKEIKKNVQEEVLHFILTLLKNKVGGFFVECGANDGEFFSNTLTLELSHNWTGILIEADPRPFTRLKRRGRNAWLVDACLSTGNVSKKVEMLRNDKSEGLSYIPGMRKMIGNVTDYYKFEAQCFPFYSILKAVGVVVIDYFSLDIEGAELSVLKTIPWKLVNIKTLSIEVHPEYEAPVKEFMTRVGYKFIRIIRNEYSHDQIYAHSSLHLA